MFVCLNAHIEGTEKTENEKKDLNLICFNSDATLQIKTVSSLVYKTLDYIHRTELFSLRFGTDV